MREGTSSNFVQPANLKVHSSSSYSIRNILETPCSPPTASANTAGRANITALAPSPKALKTSVPRRIPPSRKIGISPFTSAAIAGRTSMVAGVLSNCRPPWFETTMAAAPTSMAHRASSGCRMPFAMIGRFADCFQPSDDAPVQRQVLLCFELHQLLIHHITQHLNVGKLTHAI